MKKRFAVILAGCGNKDGSEIQESVLTLLAIDKAGHAYQCFAPDIEQRRVLNFLTNEELSQKRNVLIESARIARSKIQPLSHFNAADNDILILPGGSGVAYNLCSYAVEGAQMSVLSEVAHAVRSMHQAKKPIGALCISPVIIAKLIPSVTVTFGHDKRANDAFAALGVHTQDKEAQDIVIDRANKIVTTPCYMVEASISQIAVGIERCVNALTELTHA